MYKISLVFIFIISLSSIVLSQVEKQYYKILFKSECSISDAIGIVYNTYSTVVGDDNTYNLNIERYQFNLKEIVLNLENEPNAEQIHYLNENINLASFELVNNKSWNEEYKEFIKNYSDKTKKGLIIPELPNYTLILKYKFNANKDFEQKVLFGLFGAIKGYSYEKDANELIISLPITKSEYFIQQLKEDNNVVFVEKL